MTAKIDPNRERWLKQESERRRAKSPPKPAGVVSEVKVNGRPFNPFASMMIDVVLGGAPRPAAPPPPKPPEVTWDDIIGQAAAKAAVREAIEGLTDPARVALYKRYGRKPTKGILLYGPPGNGKTMLGKAAAGALRALAADRPAASVRSLSDFERALYGAVHMPAPQPTGDDAFIYVKGPELFNPYWGKSEERVRGLFERAKRHREAAGYPAIIFVDEAEGILGRRGGRQTMDGLVQAFLIEMDGLDGSSAIVILATNRPEALDPAVIREGRIDRKILVGRPSREDAQALIAHGLRGRPVEDTAHVAARAAAYLYKSEHALYRVYLNDGAPRTVTLGDFTSGAQLAYLVEAASTFAIERALAGTDDGIRVEDFEAAVLRTLAEQRNLDHPDELATYVEAFARDVREVERVGKDGQFSKRSVIAKMPAHADGAKFTKAVA